MEERKMPPLPPLRPERPAKKRVWPVVLAVVLALAVGYAMGSAHLLERAAEAVSMWSPADENKTDSDITWSISGKRLFISGTGEMEDWGTFWDRPPWDKEEFETVTITGDLTRIGNNAFAGHKDLCSVTIFGLVEEIGERAFADCRNLSILHITSSLKQIEKNAFSGCNGLEDLSGNDRNWSGVQIGSGNDEFLRLIED